LNKLFVANIFVIHITIFVYWDLLIEDAIGCSPGLLY